MCERNKQATCNIICATPLQFRAMSHNENSVSLRLLVIFKCVLKCWYNLVILCQEALQFHTEKYTITYSKTSKEARSLTDKLVKWLQRSLNSYKCSL